MASNSLIKELLKKMNVNVDSFESEIRRKVDNKAKMSGGARSANGIYVAQDVDEMLVEAENIASRMKDDYVSVEHIMIAMLDKPNKTIREIFRTFDVKKEEFLRELKTVRGNVRVTTDNPESTYDALSKYGQDLVEAARTGKLDPVIGRDNEIRNVIRILSRKTKNWKNDSRIRM